MCRISLAQSTQALNGVRGKGNFNVKNERGHDHDVEPAEMVGS